MGQAAMRANQRDFTILGKAPLVRAVFEGHDIGALWRPLFARLSADPGDAGAFLDVSILLRAIGRDGDATISQRAALELARTFRIRNGNGGGAIIVALVTEGDFMANTPVEFLLEDSDTTLILHYVDADTADLADLPAHDAVIVAVGESEANQPVLRRLARLLDGWRGPILNNAPGRIAGLTREGVAVCFADAPAIVAPPVGRATRFDLAQVAAGAARVDAVLDGLDYPFIIRPLGSHAGKGLERIADAPTLARFLAGRPETAFHVSPFIDYRGADGKYRKQRVAVIDGVPFASHQAVSDHWMIHYLNAGMTEHADRRAEEAAWMATFDSGYARRHAEAFAVLHRRLGLDYFAIDCAELADGRLLLFEADVAMIVHAMDPVGLFPYKKPAMRRLFAAFEAALARRASA